MCYSAGIGRESIQTYAIPVLILLHNVNALLIFHFSLQDFCSNSFQKYQDLPTSGAVDVEQFTINGNQFLAVANSRSDTDGFNTESFIYKMNNFTEKFSLYQTINTMDAADMTYFTMADKHYLAVANRRSVFKDRLNSTIYQWNGQEFVVFQNVATKGARKLFFFKIGIEPFLSVVNVYHGYVDSVIYKWRNNSFDEFQKLLRNGNYGASAAFVINNETFIAVAADSHFYVFKWSGEKFLEVQSKNTYGARDVKSFKMNGQIFLAIANSGDGSKTNIFKWSGNHFVSFQSIRTYGAIAWHPFVMCGQTFLGVANYGGKSVVYQAIGSRFVKYQEFSTQGAHGMTSFVHRGHTYLVVANAISGQDEFNINSTVYKLI